MRPPRQPPRSSIAEEELSEYDRVVMRYFVPDGKPFPAEGSPDEAYAVLPYAAATLNSPPFAVAIGHMGSLGRMAGDRDNTFTHAQREWIDQVLCYDWGWYGILTAHTPDALAVGVRLEAIEALRDGRLGDMTGEERLLTNYIRQVESGTVDDATFDQVEALMGTRGVVEYTIFIGQLMLTIRCFQAFNAIQPTVTREQIDVLLEEFKTGKRELPDWRKRIRAT